MRNQWKTLKIVHAIVLAGIGTTIGTTIGATKEENRAASKENCRNGWSKHEKNLPELVPESIVGGGVVANLRATSDNDELNATKVELERQKMCRNIQGWKQLLFFMRRYDWVWVLCR